MKKSMQSGLVAALAAALWAGLTTDASADVYVSLSGTGSGTSWADATNSLQGAIDACPVGQKVWVADGLYNTGGRTNYPSGTVVTNRVVIWKAITVSSTNSDPSATVIKGAWDPVTTNGPASVRGVYMAANSTLIGITVTNGSCGTNTSLAGYYYGGGVYCADNTTVVLSNCVVSGCAATRVSAVNAGGGGVYKGRLYNCSLSGNLAYQGAGANSSVLSNCTLRGNTALPLPAGSLNPRGGGAYGCTLYDCTVEENQSGENGGGLHTCTVYGGTIRNNACTNGNRSGGGAASSSIFNCLISGNAAYSGGGAYGCALSNCTLMANLVVTNLTTGIYIYPTGAGAAGSSGLTNCLIVANTNTANNGGGVHGSTLRNCVVLSNVCLNGGSGGGTHSSTLYNCGLTNNATYGNSGTVAGGGGANGGGLYDCAIVGNYSYNGGGANSAVLSNCYVAANMVATNGMASTAPTGGGTYGCTLTNCTLVWNTNLNANGGGAYIGTMTGCLVASNYCGGTYGGGFAGTGTDKANHRAYNCKFLDNRTKRGGGVYGASVYNSLIAGNISDDGYGGGAQDCWLWNCTVVSNRLGIAATTGGGLYDCKAVTNCIVYFNYNSAGTINNYSVGQTSGDCTNFGYTCTWPAKANWDASNFTNDPRMVNWPARDYRLDRGSPCIDKGLSIGWMTDPADVRRKDLDGVPRVRGTGVDLGAYESVPPPVGTVVLIR